MRLARATVLGGSGFIGRYIVQRLAAKGAVVAVVSRHARDAGFLRPLGDVGQIALIDAGLGDEARLAAALDGADAVVSSVGILYERGRQSFAAVHVHGPARLARLAQAAGVRRFVHISALAADIQSSSAYARSKAEGEAAVRAGFPGATILRPSVVFGPEDSFFNRFAALAIYLPALPLIGGGMTRFQPVYVGDVAAAVMAALTRPEAGGRIYQLGGPGIYTFRELMELMLREIRRRRALISIPFGLARFEAFFLEHLPGRPLLTRDQVRLLEHDSIVQQGAPGLADLGISPTAVELVLPTYLEAYRRGGRYAGTRTILAGPSES
jgi:NADH dehydrogenase